MLTEQMGSKPIDDDPDWVVSRKAEAYLEEKKLQEDPFPVPVGNKRAKEIIAKVAADNSPRKKGRPKKGA